MCVWHESIPLIPLMLQGGDVAVALSRAARVFHAVDAITGSSESVDLPAWRGYL